MEQIQDIDVMNPQARIINAYMTYLLNNGQKPASIYRFTQDLGMPEQDFYTYFGSFSAIERKIWLDFLDTTILRIESDVHYNGFDTRDKLLTFYYAFFEEIRKSRSFVLLQLEPSKRYDLVPDYLKDFRSRFTNYIESVINIGKNNGDVAKRPFIDKRYPSIFWLHMSFLLHFWRDDSSPSFERTDAAIEKSVTLAFELIGKGAVDSVVDFAKFLYQTKVK